MNNPKTIAISGTTSGIGRATALKLARDGHNIITINRPSQREVDAFQELQAVGSGEKRQIRADLATEAGAREAAYAIAAGTAKLDVLINNAGVFKTRESFSADGLEMTFAVNVRAPAILTAALLPLLQMSGRGRVLFLSSELYKRAKVSPDDPLNPGKFHSSRVYAHSKMMVTLLAGVLAQSYPVTDFYSIHPGVIATNAFRDYPRIFTRVMNWLLPGPEKAAELLATIAVGEISAPNGSYFMEGTAATVIEPPQAEAVRNVLRQYVESFR
jgi:NAD(P)-dependent dehydrogenase (short-subunit alcohol dehydrogenase family)